jgi:hypothetical protein
VHITIDHGVLPLAARWTKALAAAALTGGSLSLLTPEAGARSGAQKLDKELNFYIWSQWEGLTCHQ